MNIFFDYKIKLYNFFKSIEKNNILSTVLYQENIDLSEEEKFEIKKIINKPSKGDINFLLFGDNE